MGHSHVHHDHAEPRRYTLVFVLAMILFFMELIVGSRAHSLSLVGDAWHVLADGGAIALALFIAIFIRDKEPARVARIRKFGAYIQGILLLVVAFWMFREAFERLRAPQVHNLGWVITIAILGTFGNYVQHLIVTHQNKSNNITKRALDVHILSDLAQSVAVVLGTFLIAVTKKPIIDPILSFGIASWMTVWTAQILRDAYRGSVHSCAHHH